MRLLPFCPTALPAAAATPLAAVLLPVLAYVAIQRTVELNLSLR